MIIYKYLLLKYRIQDINRKAKELSELTQELQKQREKRENEAHNFQPIVNSNYQEQINVRLRELSELSKCGTIDVALKVASDLL